MDIQANIRILATIQTGSVYYFEEEQLASPEPHYFIVLNKEPRTDDVLILVVASSQVEKRKNRAIHLGFPPETLTFVSPTDYPLFIKETVIDCNQAFEKTTKSLIEKLESGTLKVCTEIMSETIVASLVNGVLASNQIPETVKQMLRDSSE